MKQILLLILVISIFSCTSRYDDKKQVVEEAKELNPVIEQISIRRIYSIYVIEYEGCKYFTKLDGAITHVETCNNTIH
jgi:thioredoxin-related protein